jgi:hypothetical protein
MINKKHICLVLHCLRQTEAAPDVHPELSIPLSELEALILELKQQNFEFCLPQDAKNYSGKTCSFTFDDGYFNNQLFLKLAERYKIPFILFVSSYNIINKIPFIWDYMMNKKIQEWGFAKKDYRNIYSEIAKSDFQSLMTENHRPFTPEELLSFNQNTFAYLGLHTHSHQPLVGRFIDNAQFELEENRQFLKSYPKALLQDLALPNGLYDRKTLNILRGSCSRSYTIRGGGFSPDSNIISRISLINSTYGGKLITQIEKSFSVKRKLLRIIESLKNG